MQFSSLCDNRSIREKSFLKSARNFAIRIFLADLVKSASLSNTCALPNILRTAEGSDLWIATFQPVKGDNRGVLWVHVYIKNPKLHLFELFGEVLNKKFDSKLTKI